MLVIVTNIVPAFVSLRVTRNKVIETKAKTEITPLSILATLLCFNLENKLHIN